MKGIEPERAMAIFEKDGVKYRNGMDSSRGKLYFYSTEPKFILTFASLEEKEKFKLDHKDLDEIHELYSPDRTKCKD